MASNNQFGNPVYDLAVRNLVNCGIQFAQDPSFPVDHLMFLLGDLRKRCIEQKGLSYWKNCIDIEDFVVREYPLPGSQISSSTSGQSASGLGNSGGINPTANQNQAILDILQNVETEVNNLIANASNDFNQMLAELPSTDLAMPIEMDLLPLPVLPFQNENHPDYEALATPDEDSD